MFQGAPPRDAAFNAVQTSSSVTQQLTSQQLNTEQLLVQGIPLDEYICRVVQNVCATFPPLPAPPPSDPEPFLQYQYSGSTAPVMMTAPAPTQPPPPAPAPAPAPAPTPPLQSQQPPPPPPPAPTQYLAQTHASYAHVADVAHAYYDPINGKAGFVLTSDDNGHGSWQPLPRSGDLDGPLQSRLNSVAVFDTCHGNVVRDSAATIVDGVLKVPDIHVQRITFDGGTVLNAQTVGQAPAPASPLNEKKDYKQLVSEEFIGKRALLDDITAQKASVATLVIPADKGVVAPGSVLTAIAPDGTCGWKELPAAAKSPGTSLSDTLRSDDSQCTVVFHGAADADVPTTTPWLSWNQSTQQVSVGQNATRISMGASALFNAPNGVQSVVAIGPHTLKDTQVSESVAIGSFSQTSARSARRNTSVGIETLRDNLEADDNSAFGYQSLAKAQAPCNTAYGAISLASVDTGSQNTALGAKTGSAVAKASNGVYLGYEAGPSDDFDDCICLGAFAKAMGKGDFALGSAEAPLGTSTVATSGNLSVLNPALYLNVTLNGKAYKLALYEA